MFARNQLVEQMRHVRDEKRRLRRTIRDMEADVLRKQSAVSVLRFDAADDGHEHRAATLEELPPGQLHGGTR